MGQFLHPNVVKLYGVVTVGEPVSVCVCVCSIHVHVQVCRVSFLAYINRSALV